MKNFILTILFALTAVGCGASTQRVETTIDAGCVAATTAGCFESASECFEAFTNAIDNQEITPDVVNAILNLSTCDEIRDALSEYSRAE